MFIISDVLEVAVLPQQNIYFTHFLKCKMIVFRNVIGRIIFITAMWFVFFNNQTFVFYKHSYF
jgi:hypothetical protein